MAKFIKKENKVKYEIKDLGVHSDERGWLIEMLKENELKDKIRQIYVATIKPGCVRGNHYHLKRIEWFFIATGKAELILEDIETKEKVCFKLSSKRPKVITVFPKIAHTVKNSGKETIYLVSAQNDIYNPKDPDTFANLVC